MESLAWYLVVRSGSLIVNRVGEMVSSFSVLSTLTSNLWPCCALSAPNPAPLQAARCRVRSQTPYVLQYRLGSAVRLLGSANNVPTASPRVE